MNRRPSTLPEVGKQVLVMMFVLLLAGCGSGNTKVVRELRKVSGQLDELKGKIDRLDARVEQIAVKTDTQKSLPVLPPELANVPPELGGPGFTGEGWQTASPEPLGDPDAVKGGLIRSSIPSWPENLRMYGTGSNTYLNSIVGGLCYNSLLGLHPKTLEHIPSLATHWKISEDKMTFHFRIDPRARWSDGRPVVADDVVATYTLIMDDTLVDPMSKQVMSKMEEPVVLSPFMIEVKCKEKHWRNFLTFSGTTILPAHEIGSITGKEYLKKYNFSYTATTGPYIVYSWDIKKNESLTVTRRSDYWAADYEKNKGLYNFDKIKFVVVRDNRLAFDKACKGELDFYPVYTAKWWVEDISPLEAVKKGHLIRQKFFTKGPQGFQGMAFNTRKPPLDDVGVRKALAHLYDRKTLIKKFAYNEYMRLKSYYPGGDAENPDNEMVEYDPKKAVELLAKAGWKDRDSDLVLMKDGKRLSLTIMYRSKEFEKYLTSFQEACRKAGVQIKLSLVTPETHWKNMMDRKFEIAGMAWGAVLFPNPKSGWSSEMAGKVGSNNITGFANEEADEIMAKYDQEFDVAKRTELLRRLDGLIFKEHPYSFEWYLPCERILYWNKLGMPEYGLDKYSDWSDVYSSWWIDPEKEKTLRQARKAGQAITPVPPIEVHYWEKKEKADKEKAGTEKANKEA